MFVIEPVLLNDPVFVNDPDFKVRLPFSIIRLPSLLVIDPVTFNDPLKSLVVPPRSISFPVEDTIFVSALIITTVPEVGSKLLTLSVLICFIIHMLKEFIPHVLYQKQLYDLFLSYCNLFQHTYQIQVDTF